jgi:hypothetical protein
MKNITMAELGYEEKIRHRAKLISKNGGVSPLCAKRPKKINLAKESWTIRDEAVTCPKCKALLASRLQKGDRK